MKGNIFQFAIIAAAAGCVVLFFVVAVRFNTILLGDIPSSFIGAAVSAFITGVITLIFLQRQTAAEEDTERNVEVFRKKSKVFQAYIKTVWEIWEDQKVTSEEFQRLTTGYYRDLMIYLDDKKLFQTKDEPSKDAAEILRESVGKSSLIICQGDYEDRRLP